MVALLGEANRPGAIKEASPVAHDEIVGDDVSVGRLRPLQLPPPVAPGASPPTAPAPPILVPPMAPPPIA